MITPEQLAASGSEHGAQAAIFCWANLNLTKYPELKWLFAIPNGGARDKRTGAKLKAEGVKPGVPDIFLPIKRGPYSGLWIELKVKKNKPSNEQLEWVDALRSQGYGAMACIGWEVARDMIIQYLEYK